MRRFRFLGALLTTVSLTMSASSPYLSDWARVSCAPVAVVAIVVGLIQWRGDGALIKASRPVT